MAARNGTRSTNEMVAYVFGALFVLTGIVGFFLTGFDGFTSKEGPLLLFFEVNPLHNVAHLLIGVVLIAGARGGVESARQMNLYVGVGYGLLGVAGFFLQDTSADVLAFNTADHFLHLFSAAVLLIAAFAADKQTRRTATAS